MPRLFIALDLPDEVKEALNQFREPHKDLRWVRAEQRHLTLRFLGDCSETDRQVLETALAAITHPAFTLQPTGLGVFPNRRRPRVLWVGLAAQPMLQTLYQAVEEAVREAGLSPANSPFRVHLTLARLKKPNRIWVDEFLQRHLPFEGPSYSVQAFHLYASELHPAGAQHKRLASFPLG